MMANLSTEALIRLKPVEESSETIGCDLGLDIRFTETVNVIVPQMALSENLNGEGRAEIDATALGKYLKEETQCTRHFLSLGDEGGEILLLEG
uniref:Uncharacterized protein n=1 Tax=Parascaris equorum TaxID=6256 RepID=A0A914RPC9_PAREQ